ncbi:MAG: hypothetical protein HY694_03625 [Deltaproteobacteria bacterium]|nr:hypothetical protein [Deltaproteobacteria bacterium]
MTEFGAVYRQELNRHGYPFQNSVIRAAKELFEAGKSPWIFRAAEFPVSVRGKVTHIDFILEHRDNPLYLIGECKRVNPALSNWCFARSLFTRRNPQETKLIIQSIWQSERASHTVLTGISSENSEQIYHLGLEIKSNKKGDNQGQQKGEALNKGAEQACLGINGMIEFFATRPTLLAGRGKVHLLPAIFTTAQIFTSNVDLGSANIKTGDLDNTTVALIEQPWIWLQYNISPTLSHSQHVSPAARSMESVLEQEFCRSIAIVSPQGIESFLSRDWWLA